MAGTQKITADGVIGTTGKPVRLYSFSMLSGAGGPGVVILYNGSDNTGVELDRFIGTADSITSKNYGEAGKYFPSGLYVDFDSDISYFSADYLQVTV